MAKVLDASCQAGTVTAEGVPVQGATVLSEGVGSSTGVLVIEADKKTYIGKTSPDLKSSIETLATALGDIVSALQNIGLAMTGPTTAPPPTLAVDLAKLTSAQSQLNTLKGMLK